MILCVWKISSKLVAQYLLPDGYAILGQVHEVLDKPHRIDELVSRVDHIGRPPIKFLWNIVQTPSTTTQNHWNGTLRMLPSCVPFPPIIFAPGIADVFEALPGRFTGRRV